MGILKENLRRCEFGLVAFLLPTLFPDLISCLSDILSVLGQMHLLPARTPLVSPPPSSSS